MASMGHVNQRLAGHASPSPVQDLSRGTPEVAATPDVTPDVTPITTPQQLRAALGGASTSSGVNTIRRRLEPVDIDWLGACATWFMATAAADGSCDVSPRGDQPGGVHVLDGTHLVLPERAGNRRGDGYANLLTSPGIGLIFVIPGRVDTLRINGRAVMVSDAPWFDQLALGGARPPLAILVDIDEVFYHCVKAFTRSGIWAPNTWAPEAAPSRSDIAAALHVDGVVGQETRDALMLLRNASFGRYLAG